MRIVAVLVFACLALSGCGADGAGGNVVKFSDGSEVDLEGEAPTTGKGSIVGVVVDPTIRPIAGAVVRVTGLQAEAVTDSSGVFQITDLDPGTYFFTVNAVDFTSTQASTDVRADEVSRVKVQLDIDRTPKPSHTTLHYTGFIHFWGGIAHFLVLTSDDNDTVCQCVFRFTPEPGVSTFVLEAVWEDVLPDPAGMAEYYPELFQQGQGLDFNGYCFSPCLFHIPADGMVQGAEVLVRFTGPDYWPSSQQEFDVFVTVFYNGAAPEDWSFVAGDE